MAASGSVEVDQVLDGLTEPVVEGSEGASLFESRRGEIMHDGDPSVVNVKACDIVVVLPPSEGHADSAIALPQSGGPLLELRALEDMPGLEVDQTKLDQSNGLGRVVEAIGQIGLGDQLRHGTNPTDRLARIMPDAAKRQSGSIRLGVLMLGGFGFCGVIWNGWMCRVGVPLRLG